MESGEGLSVDGVDSVPSTSTNVDANANATKHKKRNPKKCKKCGSSVINLSCHQKDVHGMTSSQFLANSCSQDTVFSSIFSCVNTPNANMADLSGGPGLVAWKRG